MIVEPYLSPQVNIPWMKIQVTPLPQEVNMTRVRRPSSTKAKHLPYPWENMTTLGIGMYLHKQKISKVFTQKQKYAKREIKALPCRLVEE